jgi:hypothetical protein
VLGRQVALDDEPYTIIGVMPPRFWFDGRDGWFPFPFNLGDAPRNSGRAFAILAKLKPGVSESQAKAELELLARQNEQAFAATNPEYVGRGIYLQPYRDFVYGTMRPVVLILLGICRLQCSRSRWRRAGKHRFRPDRGTTGIPRDGHRDGIESAAP